MQLRPLEEGKFYLKDATAGCIGRFLRTGRQVKCPKSCQFDLLDRFVVVYKMIVSSASSPEMESNFMQMHHFHARFSTSSLKTLKITT